MTTVELTPDDLLAGADAAFEIAIPAEVLQPGQHRGESPNASPPDTASKVVHLRPLTIGTFQLIMKAARQDPGLIPLLMIKESLVQPQLSLEQARSMHLGLVNFLVEQIRQISGLAEKKT
jgi:hypothetical protein